MNLLDAVLCCMCHFFVLLVTRLCEVQTAGRGSPAASVAKLSSAAHFNRLNTKLHSSSSDETTTNLDDTKLSSSSLLNGGLNKNSKESKSPALLNASSSAASVVSLAPGAITNDTYMNNSGLTLTAVSQIRRYLFFEQRTGNLKYDSFFGPDYPFATNVSVQVWPLALIAVDEAMQRISFQLDITLYWNDPRLRWPENLLQIFNISNSISSSHEQQQLLLLPFSNSRKETVWKPELLNHEAISENAARMSAQRVVGRADGRMRMRGAFYDERTCTFRARYFPFDLQCCPFTVAATNLARLYSHEPSEAFVTRVWRQLRNGMGDIYSRFDDDNNNDNISYSNDPALNKLKLSYDSGEWHLFSRREFLLPAMHSARTLRMFNSDLKLLQYRLIIRRSPGQHVLYYVMPPIVVSMFTVVAVFEGCDSSERMSFAAPIMLTMSVMLNDLRQKLATGADGYPVLAQLYLGLMVSLVATMGASSLPEKFYPQEEEGVCSNWLTKKTKALQVQLINSAGNWRIAVKLIQLRLLSRVWPKNRRTCGRLLMTSILIFQIIIICSAIVQWLLHPLGDLARIFGRQMSVDDFCAR